MPRMQLVRGVWWAMLYVALSVAPLGIILLGPSTPPAGGSRSFVTELSVALGFCGLAMMTLQFALTARFEWLKAPYGSDVVYHFHKVISLVAVAFVALHPALLFAERFSAVAARAVTHPRPFWTGVAALSCVAGVVLVSVFRRRWNIEYIRWRRTHAVFAVAAVALGVAHALFVGHYLDHPETRLLWLAYTTCFVALIAYVRVVKPWRESRRPWEVLEVRPERGDAATIVLRPAGHRGLRFSPGQFAWVTAFASPWSDRDHPFSFSGSAERAAREGVVEFTIKAAGDFTRRIPELRPGDRVYVDGPFGALSADRHPGAAGLVFIAGGVGITPMMSHLRTLRDRGDPRPLLLFYAAKDWESLTFREEIEAMRMAMPNLRVVYVLGDAPPGVEYVRGFLTRDVLAAHLPPRRPGERVEHFICGPTPMMTAVERSLSELGVPMGDYHSEEFNLV